MKGGERVFTFSRCCSTPAGQRVPRGCRSIDQVTYYNSVQYFVSECHEMFHNRGNMEEVYKGIDLAKQLVIGHYFMLCCVVYFMRVLVCLSLVTASNHCVSSGQLY